MNTTIAIVLLFGLSCALLGYGAGRFRTRAERRAMLRLVEAVDQLAVAVELLAPSAMTSDDLGETLARAFH